MQDHLHEPTLCPDLLCPQRNYEDEFKLAMMQLYEGWQTGKGEGVNITIIQSLARADSKYKHLTQLKQWTTKQKSSELLGLQAKLDSLQN
jgi:hypothetical protein